MLVSKPAAVFLGLLALAVFLLRDALFFGGAFYERDVLIYMQMAEAFVRSIAEGGLPLRDPTMGFGQPILGTPDAGVFYPPTWLNLILLPERAYPFFVLFHYVLGASGAAALAFRFSRSASGSFFAGSFWLVCGPFQSFLTLWHHLAGAAWMPWVLTVFDRLLSAPSRRGTFILGAFFGLQILAGSADMCAMTLALALLRLLCEAKEASSSSIFRVLRASFVALALAAGLGAATWLTVAEISRSSLRASLPENVRTYWSVNPVLVAEMAMPLGLGSMGLNGEAKDVLFDGREPFVKSLFLGPLILPLFLGALAARDLPSRYRWFSGLAALGSLLMSFGSYTPVYEIVTTVAPFLKIFRFPSKVVIPLSMVACVLAGVAVEALRDHQARRIARIGAVVDCLARRLSPSDIRACDPAG